MCVGYTEVTERVLENKVAQSFVLDLLSTPMDAILWLRHRHWPSKLDILRQMQDRFPEVFLDEEVVLRQLSEEMFQQIVKDASRGKANAEDGTKLFWHYRRMDVLHLDDLDEYAEGGQGPAGSAPPAEEAFMRRLRSLST
eukprot:scaffold122826_cov46-Prasinocladus_malaysianus.AAC.1